MSTLKVDALSSKTTNGDLAITGDGSGVPDIEAGFKVGGTAGVPVSSIRDGTDGELITWDSSGDATTVPVGTATHILTSNGAGAAPTFQAAAGGGAWTKISDVTASDSSNLVFSSGIDATYPFYAWICEDMRFVLQQTNFEMHLSEDGGSSYKTDKYQGFYHEGPSSGSTAHAIGNFNEDANWIITSRLPGHGPNANGSNTNDDKPERTISCIIYASTLTGTTFTPKMWADGVFNSYQTFIQRLLSCGGQAGSAGMGGAYGDPWDVDAVKFECSSGNIVSGTITMYGISS